MAKDKLSPLEAAGVGTAAAGTAFDIGTGVADLFRSNRPAQESMSSVEAALSERARRDFLQNIGRPEIQNILADLRAGSAKLGERAGGVSDILFERGQAPSGIKNVAGLEAAVSPTAERIISKIFEAQDPLFRRRQTQLLESAPSSSIGRQEAAGTLAQRELDRSSAAAQLFPQLFGTAQRAEQLGLAEEELRMQELASALGIPLDVLLGTTSARAGTVRAGV
jgi:hypothetical protein